MTDVEKSRKNSADRSRACYYKHLEKSREDTAEHSKTCLTINIWKNPGKTKLNALKCGRVTARHSVALLLL